MKWNQIKDEKKEEKLVVRCTYTCVWGGGRGGGQITQIIFHILHNDSLGFTHNYTMINIVASLSVSVGTCGKEKELVRILLYKNQLWFMLAMLFKSSEKKC